MINMWYNGKYTGNRQISTFGRIKSMQAHICVPEKGVAMIRWADKLYLSGDITPRKKARLMKAIENGQLTFEVYCIAFASNPENLFDIINANDLLFPYYRRKEMEVLGLAASRGTAKLLVKDMLEEVYKATGGFKVREYFSIR